MCQPDAETKSKCINISRRKCLKNKSIMLLLVVNILLFSCNDRKTTKTKSLKNASIKLIGGHGVSDGFFHLPRTVAFSGLDKVFYVIDKTGRIQKFAEEGRFLKSWKVPASPTIELAKRGYPAGIEINLRNELYVCDSHQGKVLVYSSEGKLLREFGKLGSKLGEFSLSGRVAFLPDNSFFVSDYAGTKERVTFFDKNENAKFAFGSSGSGEGEFFRSIGICADDEKNIYVCDAGNHRIHKFSKQGKLIKTFGVKGREKGQVMYPYGISFEPELKLLFIAEFGNSRLSFFTKQGDCVGVFGQYGVGKDEFAGVWDVEIGDKYYYVPDYNNNRVTLITKAYLRTFIKH